MNSWFDITWAVHGSAKTKVIRIVVAAYQPCAFFSQAHTFLLMISYTVNRSIPQGMDAGYCCLIQPCFFPFQKEFNVLDQSP